MNQQSGADAKLRDELEAALKREKKAEFKLVRLETVVWHDTFSESCQSRKFVAPQKNVNKLIEKSKHSQVIGKSILIAVLNAKTDAEVDGILKRPDNSANASESLT